MTLNSVHKPLNNSLFHNARFHRLIQGHSPGALPQHHHHMTSPAHNPAEAPSNAISKRLAVLTGLSLFLTCPQVLASDTDLVLFIPNSTKTPAIRAGTVDPKNPYRFSLPPTWKEARVPNILSGNYCQPKCGEPWIEVIFEDKEQGKATVVACPLFKLTGKLDARIEEIATPKELLGSIGPYITGSYLDEESVVAINSKKQDDNLTYYYYEVSTPYDKKSQHSLSTITSKGEVALLFVLSATEKQWKNSENKLREVVETFRA